MSSYDRGGDWIACSCGGRGSGSEEEEEEGTGVAEREVPPGWGANRHLPGRSDPPHHFEDAARG